MTERITGYKLTVFGVFPNNATNMTAMLMENATMYAVTGLQRNSRYLVVLTAVNPTGESAPTEMNVTTSEYGSGLIT